MYHELHVLLSYVEDVNVPIEPQDVSEDIQMFFSPHTYGALTLPAALEALRAKGWLMHYTTSGYHITSKGSKALMDYQCYMEVQHSKMVLL